jgi:hypothetical protein
MKKFITKIIGEPYSFVYLEKELTALDEQGWEILQVIQRQDGTYLIIAYKIKPKKTKSDE